MQRLRGFQSINKNNIFISIDLKIWRYHVRPSHGVVLEITMVIINASICPLLFPVTDSRCRTRITNNQAI